MAEVLHVFDQPLYLGGVPYAAQVVARPEGHLWEGWIEFASADGSDVRRTPRETTQPDRAAVVYWATGLSGTYLEGALRRATEPPPSRPSVAMPEPFFESPLTSPRAEVITPERAVMDPYSVGAKGEDLLRRELGALAAWHLRNIVRAYRLADESLNIERLSQAELIELIVSAVQPA
jgi:hypothetical protein